MCFDIILPDNNNVNVTYEEQTMPDNNIASVTYEGHILHDHAS